MNAAISAAVSVVGKALAPVSDGLLEKWAASDSLGTNISALKTELLRAQGILYTVHDRDITNPALNKLLYMLRQLADGAEDVLDELDYFRIQDQLDSTYDAADKHPGGCIHGFGLNARHTAKAVGNKFKLSSCFRDASSGGPEDQEDNAKQGCLSIVRTCGRRREIITSPPSLNNQRTQEVEGRCMPKVVPSAHGAAHVVGKIFPCYSLPSVQDDAHTGMPESSKAPLEDRVVQTPKLKFDRVEMSERMADIVQQLKPICANVKEILDLELRKPTQGIARNRPKSTLAIIEPELFGRDAERKSIVDGITIHGQYYADGLTVLPIIGPGGIGKTTFAQHIYREMNSSFEVSIWICVSLSFDANRLAQEIVKKIPKVEGEKENGSEEELIEQRLKHKRFLLVLDDVWTYQEDEWRKLLAPFREGEATGNMVIVTTRDPVVARMVKSVDRPIELNGLETEDIMHLFEAYVFDHQQPLTDHPELLDAGCKIVGKLKGFPLAAKTVGRLLREELTLDHWTRVLDSKEWESETSDYDIMPALKLSYDYLPFPLQQCFLYCSLFPEDYEFSSKELVCLWIGLDILHSSDLRKKVEQVGLSHLKGLVNHGFFKKNEKYGSPCYVIHDLLHELAVKVSSSECLSISRSNVRYAPSSPSVRHLSIIVDERDVNDRMSFDDFKRDLSTLHEKLKVENLKSVMLFGEYHGSFTKTFSDLLLEAKALRVILLSEASYSYTVEDVFHRLPTFVHLRYLKITSTDRAKVSLRSSISRFYHLRVLDVQQCNVHLDFQRDMSNLVKLRHFLVQDRALRSSNFEVGKLKWLQELRCFMVRNENKGFKLAQIGQLAELGGLLRICNLENVEPKEEANEANLQKSHLSNLILEWSIDQHDKNPSHEQHVLESLKPHSNLLDMRIKGHGGTACPSWLGESLSVKRLESLCLNDVGWSDLPPLGDLWFVNELGGEHKSCVSSQGFQNLKRLELVKIPRLRKWVQNGTCSFFSQLEVLLIEDCSELVELPFSGCQSEQEGIMTWFPRLWQLKIIDCPKLLSLPPLPWTLAPCSAEIKRAGSGIVQLVYTKNHRSEYSLKVHGKEGDHDSMFWNVLAFSNLVGLEHLEMTKCPPSPLDLLQKLTSLKFLEIEPSGNVLSPTDNETGVTYQLPIECLRIRRCGAGQKELTQFLSHFQNLSELRIYNCANITRVDVMEKEQTDGQPRDQKEIATSPEGEGLLLLPPQLQKLEIWNCADLNDGTLGGGLQGLRSLHSLWISDCPKFLSSYFPASLQALCLEGVEGMETLDSLLNLISLRKLTVKQCGDLIGEGIWPLLAQGSLAELSIFDTPKFFSGFESSQSQPHDKELFSLSCKLEMLETDDFTGFLAEPICSLLSSLTSLYFYKDEVEHFTKDQEAALQLLTSLKVLEFDSFNKMQCLPTELHKHSSLNALRIEFCETFVSLLKNGLPSSLQNLEIVRCPAFKSLPKDSVPSSLKKLMIHDCPALKSLPKDSLPSSLRVLDVHYGNSDELIRQCRKFKGRIPIIRD